MWLYTNCQLELSASSTTQLHQLHYMEEKAKTDFNDLVTQTSNYQELQFYGCSLVCCAWQADLHHLYLVLLLVPSSPYIGYCWACVQQQCWVWGAFSRTHSHMHMCMHAHSHTLSLSLSHTHTHTHTLSLSLTHTYTYTLSLFHRHTHTHTLSLSLSHTHTHTHTHTQTDTHTHTPFSPPLQVCKRVPLEGEELKAHRQRVREEKQAKETSEK